jgi:hypothetical protein
MTGKRLRPLCWLDCVLLEDSLNMFGSPLSPFHFESLHTSSSTSELCVIGIPKISRNLVFMNAEATSVSESRIAGRRSTKASSTSLKLSPPRFPIGAVDGF